MTTWYERVGELLDAGPGAAPDDRGGDGPPGAAFGEGVGPEDAALLLRAAVDLLPPAEARQLASRLDDAPTPPLTWTSLLRPGAGTGVVVGEAPADLDTAPSAEHGADDPGPAWGDGPRGLELHGVDLDFGGGAPDLGGAPDFGGGQPDVAGEVPDVAGGAPGVPPAVDDPSPFEPLWPRAAPDDDLDDGPVDDEGPDDGGGHEPPAPHDDWG